MEHGNLAQWAGVLVTSIAILIALFKETIISCIRRPKLRAKIEARSPYCVITPLTHNSWIGFRYFLRVMVENSGNIRAEKVEVFLSGAMAQMKDGLFTPIPGFTPMNLRWSYTSNIYVDGISPGMSRLCDFGAISDPAHPDLQCFPTPIRLALQLEARQPTSEWLTAGKYRFHIQLAGSNCKPVAHSIDLHLTGVWSNDSAQMLSNGVVIGQL